jgi:serine/threonine protein kinase
MPPLVALGEWWENPRNRRRTPPEHHILVALAWTGQSTAPSFIDPGRGVFRSRIPILGRSPDDTSTSVSRWPGNETSLAWRQLSELAERFALAWQQGADAPAVRDYLPAEPPDLRLLTLVELIKLDLEYRWQSGLRKTLPEYLAEFPELEGNPPADLIHEEYLVRKRAGEEVCWEEYRATYPERVPELTGLFRGRGTDTVSMQPFGGERSVPGSRVVPGQVIDDFEVLLPLGQGAFASVFLARQISMQRRVALKITSPRGQEHATLAQFDHPNIVRIYDHRLLESHGWRLLYMQYVPGGTVRHLVEKVRQTLPQQRTGRLLFEVIDANLKARGELELPDAPVRERCATATWPEVVCWLGARIARGLSHAHRLKVLHRDLKPANVLLAADGTPKLADFNVSFQATSSSLVPTAHFGGSLAYMSPEQLEAYDPQHPRQAESLDARSDLYSLGITLHELLLGTRPFPVEKAIENWQEVVARMTAVRRAGPPIDVWQQEETAWPPGLRQILERLLAPDPSQRFASGQELARKLETCLQPATLQLLFPHPRQWRGLLRTWAQTALLTLVLVPNLLAALFNLRFHLHRIPAIPERIGSPWLAAVFGLVVLLGGLVLCLWRGRPVIRAVQSPQSAAALAPAAAQGLRSRCLRLGPEAATISLSAWMLLSLGCGLAIRLSSGANSAAPVSEFAVSLLLGGLIAVAYPYCGVSWLAVCVLYPGLAPPERFTAEDRRELRQLRQNSWLFLLLAAVMPLAAVALSIMLDRDDASRGQRIDLIGLAIAGIIGLSFSMISFRALQRDLQLILWMLAPRQDSHDSTEDLGSWFAPDL